MTIIYQIFIYEKYNNKINNNNNLFIKSILNYNLINNIKYLFYNKCYNNYILNCENINIYKKSERKHLNSIRDLYYVDHKTLGEGGYGTVRKGISNFILFIIIKVYFFFFFIIIIIMHYFRKT